MSKRWDFVKKTFAKKKSVLSRPTVMRRSATPPRFEEVPGFNTGMDVYIRHKLVIPRT